MPGVRARSASASLGPLPVHVGQQSGRPDGARGHGQYARRVTPEQLQDVVRTAVAAAVERGALPVEVPGEVVVERPKNPEHGDWSTNVALQIARDLKRRPREIAEELRNATTDALVQSGITTAAGISIAW